MASSDLGRRPGSGACVPRRPPRERRASCRIAATGGAHLASGREEDPVSVEFTGRAREYFGIWLANAALSIATGLGQGSQPPLLSGERRRSRRPDGLSRDGNGGSQGTPLGGARGRRLRRALLRGAMVGAGRRGRRAGPSVDHQSVHDVQRPHDLAAQRPLAWRVLGSRENLPLPAVGRRADARHPCARGSPPRSRTPR